MLVGTDLIINLRSVSLDPLVRDVRKIVLVQIKLFKYFHQLIVVRDVKHGARLRILVLTRGDWVARAPVE